MKKIGDFFSIIRPDLHFHLTESFGSLEKNNTCLGILEIYGTEIGGRNFLDRAYIAMRYI